MKFKAAFLNSLILMLGLMLGTISEANMDGDGLLTAARGSLETLAEATAKDLGMEGLVYRDEIMQADAQLSQIGFYLVADNNWMESRGRELIERPKLIGDATLSEIRLLLGGISRQERFNPGLLGKSIVDGVYREVAKKLYAPNF